MTHYTHISVQTEPSEDSEELIAPDQREPDMNFVLDNAQKVSGSLGEFLRDVFSVPPRKEPGRSQKHAQMVSRFLQGRSAVKAEEIVELMYEHHDSAPKAARETAERPASDAIRPDEKPMARWNIREWAIKTIEGIVHKEADTVSSKAGGLHLPKEEATWEFFHNFSFGNVMSVVQTKAPTLIRVLTAAAIPPKKQREMSDPLEAGTFANHFSKPVSPGSGNNRRDPLVVSVLPPFL
jgi:hypothetical protein